MIILIEFIDHLVAKKSDADPLVSSMTTTASARQIPQPPVIASVIGKDSGHDDHISINK